MPSRLNFVLVFNHPENLRAIVPGALSFFSAYVQSWQIVGKDEVTNVDDRAVHGAVDAGMVVLAVTSLEPSIRVHVSSEGQFDVVTISFAERLQHRATASEAVASLEGLVAAAIGEELEMELDSSGVPAFVGEDITVLKAKRLIR